MEQTERGPGLTARSHRPLLLGKDHDRGRVGILQQDAAGVTQVVKKGWDSG
jgi:hypothetical protein